MRELHKRLKKVRMLICDVDGVLTDGRLWISDDGKWRRFFHVHDGVGLKLLMDSGYDVGVISGGKSDDVIQRMAFLKIKHFYLEISDKIIPFQQILDESGLSADEIAFVGDEIYDVPVMNKVGFAVAVADAVPEAKKAAHFVTKKGGGQGAVREVVDLIRHYGAFAKKSGEAADGDGGERPMNRLKLLNSLALIPLFVGAMGLSTVSYGATSDVIQFPEEELPRESVLPVFDQPEAVKKKNVPYTGRFEIGVSTGKTLNDAFFDNYPAELELGYHFGEAHGLNLHLQYMASNQSPFVNQLRNQVPTAQVLAIPFGSAPTPRMLGFLEYEYTPYYGKVSVTKQTVWNMTISADLGGGYMMQNTGDNSLLFTLGINEKIFFTRNFGIRADLRGMFYQQMDIIAQVPTKKNLMNTELTIGIVYLFPTLD